MTPTRCLAGSTTVVLVVLLAACGDAAPAPTAAPPDGTYTVRAEIVRLPSSTGAEIYLRHESIPSFRDRQGETVGMMPMTMPFGAPAELDLTGLRAGDRVEATFEVRWAAARMPLRVTKLVPLPEGTRLEFDREDESEELPAEELADDEESYVDPAEGETPR